ncbi:MAG: hypothetical protein Q9167_003501 [Letrouitia subvulpina]
MRIDKHLRKRCRSNFSRLTRWTGYEVFIRNDLTLWIVFNKNSLDSGAEPWNPVSCSITKPFESIACLLPSLSELGHATYEEAKASTENTCQAAEMYIDEVEKSEVEESERDQVEIPPQDAVLPFNKGKQRADDTARADTAQTLHPPFPTTLSDTLATSQYNPLVGHDDVDTTPPVLVSAYDTGNNRGILLSRPDSRTPSTENSQTVKSQFDKIVAEVKSEDEDGRKPP